MQTREREVIRAMSVGQHQHEALASEATRAQIATEYAYLNDGQRAAVRDVLSNEDRIMALDGVAGAGKTTSLDAIRAGAEREGYEVRGLAPTSGAARKLEEAGIESQTLQRHLTRGELGDGTRRLYVVDESSLASTKQMDDFVKRLGDNDRVLLVGDTRQHQAVEAGTPYEQLQAAGMRTAHLDEIVRQKDPALRQAVEQLADGRVREAVHNLREQGRVHEIPDHGERLSAIAREYAREPQGTLIVSPDNESRREINGLVREQMQERGLVSRDEQAVTVLSPRQDMTGADRAVAAEYEVGDMLRYSKGSKPLELEAGEYVRVAAVDADKNLVTVQRSSGEEVTYDPRRLQGVSAYRESTLSLAEGDRVQFTAPSKDLDVANRDLGTVEKIDAAGDVELRMDSGRSVEFNVGQHPHLDHGYAMTSYSSQGQTADRVLVHVDTEKSPELVNSRMGYVAISRGSEDVQIFTNDAGSLAEKLGRDVSNASALGKDVAGETVKEAVKTAIEVPTVAVVVAEKAVTAVVSKVQEIVFDKGHGQEM
jgi:ATP-dependent exoDNAse (exonuclease V) alpha subunit